LREKKGMGKDFELTSDSYNTFLRDLKTRIRLGRLSRQKISAANVLVMN
jgi:hypothetical protein